MNTNPLFPKTDDMASAPGANSYVLSRGEHSVPSPDGNGQPGGNQAVDLIREKLARIYAEEPDPLAEEREAEAVTPRSTHQQFMYELSSSGKSLAEIQTAWHNYYASLPDAEKHQVWQEFYAANADKPQPPAITARSRPIAAARPEQIHNSALSQAYAHPRPAALPTQPEVMVSAPTRSLPRRDTRGAADIRKTIQYKVSAGSLPPARHHLQSLLFGLGVGIVTLVIFLFGFFNEVIVAPFIQPSRNVGATPIIINPSDVAATSTPEVIIPKIHLEIPTDYSVTSTNEATIETALEGGIVHYPSTVLPGQTGNAAFFGHSSNNIFNPGKYKFAFVLLHELAPGDTFYLTYNGKVYIYKVFDRRIVEPNAVGVLNNVPGHAATATLITCDPPGTSLHRLVVVGDQISPDPAGQPGGANTSATSVTSPNLPGNGPSLWSRIWNTIF
jgi:LPXTG-site transpeptidase (sortase) family protein